MPPRHWWICSASVVDQSINTIGIPNWNPSEKDPGAQSSQKMQRNKEKATPAISISATQSDESNQSSVIGAGDQLDEVENSKRMYQSMISSVLERHLQEEGMKKQYAGSMCCTAVGAPNKRSEHEHLEGRISISKTTVQANRSPTFGTKHAKRKLKAEDTNVKRQRRPPLNPNSPEYDLNAPETTAEGQLKLHPHLTKEEAVGLARKEYNRRNAARARYRNKFLQDELQQQVYKLIHDKEHILKERVELEQEIAHLKNKNKALLETDHALRDSLSSSLVGRYDRQTCLLGKGARPLVNEPRTHDLPSSSIASFLETKRAAAMYQANQQVDVQSLHKARTMLGEQARRRQQHDELRQKTLLELSLPTFGTAVGTGSNLALLGRPPSTSDPTPKDASIEQQEGELFENYFSK